MNALAALLVLALAAAEQSPAAPAGAPPPSAPSPPAPARPTGTAAARETKVIAEELAHFSPAEGSVLSVLVRYRSLVGARLEVEGCESVFTLPEESRFPVIADPKTRRGILEVRCRVGRGAQGETILAVEEIRATAGGEALFAELAGRLAASSPPRRRAILGWALSLSEAGSPWRERATATWTAIAPEEIQRGREDALAWLAVAHPHLESEARWIEAANRLAERYGDEREVPLKLNELGLIASSEGWHPRSNLLRDIGMVLRDGETITIDQSHLLDEIAHWKEGGQPADMLRGRTAVQYARDAEAGVVAEGMKREEVVLAWGYPDRVTWRREGDALFEGWFWPRREVYLVDGAVFFSQD